MFRKCAGALAESFADGKRCLVFNYMLSKNIASVEACFFGHAILTACSKYVYVKFFASCLNIFARFCGLLLEKIRKMRRRFFKFIRSLKHSKKASIKILV
jgi:hypothetical protein